MTNSLRQKMYQNLCWH